MGLESVNFSSILLIIALAVIFLGSKKVKEFGKEIIHTFNEIRQHSSNPMPEPISVKEQPDIKPPQD